MNNGDKTLCGANLFVGEEEPTLFQIQYFRAFTPISSVNMSLSLLRSHTQALSFDHAPEYSWYNI